MIIVGGIRSEPNVAMLTSVLTEADVPYLMLDQRKAHSCEMEFSIGDDGIDGYLRVGSQRLNLADASAVYVRFMDDTLLPEVQREDPDSALRLQVRRLHDIFYQWMDITPALVVNRNEPQGSNSSKPYQAQLIRQFGFAVPPTLITSDPAEVLAFRRQYGAVIFKSMSGVRSIVKTLSDDDLARLRDVSNCPVQFQARVEGTDVRVHVVGEEVYATEIVCAATDYRYARQSGDEAVLQSRTLPAALHERCIALTAGLGLTMSGIDLRIDQAGHATCFEVNPLPSFSYYESVTGQPIARSLATALCRAQRR